MEAKCKLFLTAFSREKDKIATPIITPDDSPVQLIASDWGDSPKGDEKVFDPLHIGSNFKRQFDVVVVGYLGEDKMKVTGNDHYAVVHPQRLDPDIYYATVVAAGDNCRSAPITFQIDWRGNFDIRFKQVPTPPSHEM
jgi:hypothetical protein